MASPTPLPAPTFTGNSSFNALDSTPFIQSQNNFSARGDHVLSAQDSVWFRYSGTFKDTTQSGGRPGLASTNENPTKNWAASWVHTFSPTTVLQAQVGRAHVTWNDHYRFTGLTSDFANQVPREVQPVPQDAPYPRRNDVRVTSQTLLDNRLTNLSNGFANGLHVW